MLRNAAFAVLAAVLIGASGCAPTIAYNGFQPIETKPQDVKVGVDTRSTVLTKLGSPSAVSTFDKNTWFYISQTTEKYAYYLPRVTKRNVVAITFDGNEKVASVKDLTLKDGYRIAYDKHETPTRGRSLSWIEQLLGTVGRGSMLPMEENTPGQQH